MLKKLWLIVIGGVLCIYEGVKGVFFSLPLLLVELIEMNLWNDVYVDCKIE